MPKKLEKLLRDLVKAGFVGRGGKGSHRNYEHACGWQITVSVHRGEAKAYQEREITEAIEIAEIWEHENEKKSQ